MYPLNGSQIVLKRNHEYALIDEWQRPEYIILLLLKLKPDCDEYIYLDTETWKYPINLSELPPLVDQ